MKLNLNEIKPGQKKERSTLNLSNLVESMDGVGQISPIVINERKEIISGFRRFYAAKELKWEKIAVVTYTGTQIDQDLAAIDSNLMTLPLGEVDHDLALSRRKKLYEQKFPETRQYSTDKSDQPPFTKDVADLLGVSRRSIEQAIKRAEKSSHRVTAARREGKISSTVTNALCQLPTSYQDKILESIEGKNVGEVKRIVQIALDRDVDVAIAKSNRFVGHVNHLENIDKQIDKLSTSLEESLKSKLKNDQIEINLTLKKANAVMNLLEKFIEKNTQVMKPILRKAQSQTVSS